MTFKTHTGEIVEGERLQEAIKAVAQMYRDQAIAIYKHNLYASHVPEETKIFNRDSSLREADILELSGEIDNFTTWQDINTYLTGECVALLPK